MLAVENGEYMEAAEALLNGGASINTVYDVRRWNTLSCCCGNRVSL